MSDNLPFGSFPSLYSPDDAHFNPMMWDLNLGQQQDLPGSSYFTSVNPRINPTDNQDLYNYGGRNPPGQPQFGGYSVQDDQSKNGLLRVDTGVLDTPRLHISSDLSSTSSLESMMPLTPYNTWGDSHLRVHIPPLSPLSPSDGYLYSAVSTTNQKGFSPIPSPHSPYSPTAMCSSDETSSFQAIEDDEDDDDGDAPQPMEHIVSWKSIRDKAVIVTGTNIYIPQSIYQPYTEADRVRYIKKANLKEPIIFETLHPDQWGIALEDALRAKMKDLHARDDHMFVDCGPSVSIRLQWPGYRSWTKQIPTMDFKSPKCPITRAKLAKNVANCVKRFIEEKEKERMESDADRRWKVGSRFIRVEDLMLVSLHHISKGSWQPQLRLLTPLSEIQQRRVLHIPPPAV